MADAVHEATVRRVGLTTPVGTVSDVASALMESKAMRATTQRAKTLLDARRPLSLFLRTLSWLGRLRGANFSHN